MRPEPEWPPPAGLFIATLSIAGLITAMVDMLSAMAMPIGDYRVTLLLLLKRANTLAVLIWLATGVSRLIEQWLRLAAVNHSPVDQSRSGHCTSRLRLCLVDSAPNIGSHVHRVTDARLARNQVPHRRREQRAAQPEQ
jgi:hypothetical protein